MKRFSGMLLLMVLIPAAAAPAHGIGLIIVDDPDEVRFLPPPPNPRMPDVPPRRLPARPVHRFTPLEMRLANASTKIRDQVAQTRIEQEFYNPNANRLEGTFYLPLPRGAHLEKFALEVNGQMVEAELLAADKARGIYEEIVRKARDPALLEYLGRDLVKVRIFPIEPHSTKRIEVSYSQLLKSDGGLVEFTLPLNTAKYCATAIRSLSVKVELESPTALKTIYSPTHDVEIKRHGEKRAVLGLEQNETRPEKDFQLFFSVERSELGLSFLTYRKSGEDGYFMLLATPGIESGKVAPKDVVFVVDTSGSMAGKKMEQAKKALRFCIDNLHPEDRFEVIRFSTEAEGLFEKLNEASDENRKQAGEFVNKLKSTGGTAINDALEAAMKTRPAGSDRPYLVVFVTDGLPTVGETAEEKIVRNVNGEHRGGTRVFCFGVGTDVNTHLLDRIAEGTRAVSQYVLPDEDLEVKVSSFFSKISDPVLADVELDFGGIRTSQLHPGKLPDLFKGQQVVAFGRYAGSGKGSAKVKGNLRGEEKVYSYPIQFGESSTEHEFIPRLWATRRVGYLLDEIRLRGENSELKEEVTTLAKQYGIVTPYTSYLVTEDTPTPVRLRVPGANEPRVELLERPHPAPVTAERRERLLSLSADKSGDAAVAGARYNSKLKETLNEAQAQSAPAELNQFAVSGRLSSAKKDVGRFAGTERFIGPRTFGFDGVAWVETMVLQLRDTSGAVRLEFNSKEYWDFASKHPGMGDVLALGTDVKFILDNKLYEVFSKK